MSFNKDKKGISIFSYKTKDDSYRLIIGNCFLYSQVWQKIMRLKIR